MWAGNACSAILTVVVNYVLTIHLTSHCLDESGKVSWGSSEGSQGKLPRWNSVVFFQNPQVSHKGMVG